MPGEWRELLRSWSNPWDPLYMVHPDSSSGGAGPGSARVNAHLNAQYISPVPSPDSPAGKQFPWQTLSLRLDPAAILTSILKMVFTSMWPKPSGWNIRTSGGFDVSVGPVGVTGGTLILFQDSAPNVDVKYSFAGAGGGYSSLPVGLDFSSINAPGSGTRIFLPEDTPEPTADDFKGLALIISGGGNFTFGASAALVVFGIKPDVSKLLKNLHVLFDNPLMLPQQMAAVTGTLRLLFALSHGAGVAYGATVGLPSIGISGYEAIVTRQ